MPSEALFGVRARYNKTTRAWTTQLLNRDGQVVADESTYDVASTPPSVVARYHVRLARKASEDAAKATDAQDNA